MVLTQQEQDTLKDYADRGDYRGGWAYLSNKGDRYADNALAITGEASQLSGLNLWMKRASVACVSRVPCLKARTRCLRFYDCARNLCATQHIKIFKPV
mgnify:CR=1 FL=1